MRCPVGCRHQDSNDKVPKELESSGCTSFLEFPRTAGNYQRSCISREVHLLESRSYGSESTT